MPRRSVTLAPFLTARSFVYVDLAMCRTLIRRPCNVSHVQYATPRCVALSVRLYYTQCHRHRSLPRHQLFIVCQGCPIHTSSVQLHIIIHVVQLRLCSYNCNHDNVIRSVTHNIMPVILYYKHQRYSVPCIITHTLIPVHIVASIRQ